MAILNNRNVTIQNLEDSGEYDANLLDALRKKNFTELFNIPVEKRADIHYMQPLLYAVKNEPALNTFIVYKHYDETLQDNTMLASEIIVDEPELIEGTPVSKNKVFIIENANFRPEIIKYMDPNLKSDSQFLQSLIEEATPEVKGEIFENCEVNALIEANPELSNDKEFMNKAIDKDVKNLEFASEQLRNDKDFLKEKSSQNEEVVSYVVDNIQKFGLEGIKGVKESSRGFTIEDSMTSVDEMSQNSEDKRYEKVKAKVQEKGADDTRAVRWLTAMAAQRDDVTPETFKKALNYSMLTMEKIKQDVSETGEMKINTENMQELITPLILNRIKGKVEAQGIVIGSDLQKKLDEYQEFYDKYKAQFVEYKKQKQVVKAGIGNMTAGEVKTVTTEVAKGIGTQKQQKNITVETPELEEK